ncbi:MAG TPA: dimethylsulfoniopropionate demethylase [Oceanospirillaceae bacterium]|nr:dimethylsulfoniopropionate demethylase [Oceanospirillaceae bacterium]
MMPQLSVSRRTRSTPFTSRVEAAGVQAYTVYNHTLLATKFRGFEADYWHLCEHVQVWDVSCEKQVAISGPDAYRLIQLMTPRDLSKARIGRCFYVPLCNPQGGIVNDPIAIKLTENDWWLSIADTDVMLWAQGLATGFNLDVNVTEPDVWPLAVQGPKAEDLMARVFGEQVRNIKFFNIKPMLYQGVPMQVARSGWSKQGGFEIYVNDASLAGALWDQLFAQGQDLNVGPGCPNLIERVESGLLSLGNDMGYDTTPLECGLDQYVDLNANIDSLSLPALRQQTPQRQLRGLVINQAVKIDDQNVYLDGQVVGQITSQAYSPKYGVHLAFVLCSLASLDVSLTLDVNTSQGTVSGQITRLPFNFNSLGLQPKAPA